MQYFYKAGTISSDNIVIKKYSMLHRLSLVNKYKLYCHLSFEKCYCVNNSIFKATQST